MPRTARTIVTSCTILLVCTACASAQGSAGASGGAATPIVRQVAPDPAVGPRGYTGFNIRFAFAMSGGQETASAPPVVDSVVPGSPAQKAGIAPGDVILEIDGRDARAQGALRVTPGVRYTYRIRRGSEEREVVLVAGTHPGDTARP